MPHRHPPSYPQKRMMVSGALSSSDFMVPMGFGLHQPTASLFSVWSLRIPPHPCAWVSNLVRPPNKTGPGPWEASRPCSLPLFLLVAGEIFTKKCCKPHPNKADQELELITNRDWDAEPLWKVSFLLPPPPPM